MACICSVYIANLCLLRQGVDPFAQWLEHWICNSGGPGFISARGGSFSAMPYFSLLRLPCCKMGALVRDRTLFRQKLALRHH